LENEAKILEGKYIVENEDRFFWTGDWHIEDEEDMAYMCSPTVAAAFKVDLNKDICFGIQQFPEKFSDKYGMFSECRKYGETLICFPRFSNTFIFLDCKTKKFAEVECKESVKNGLHIMKDYQYGSHLFLVSVGANSIIEMDPDKRAFSRCFDIPLIKEGDEINGISMMLNNRIYLLASGNAVVYEFSLTDKSFLRYELTNQKIRFRAMTFDGKKFWLGGFRRELYTWDKMKHEFSIREDIPSRFDIYDFDSEKAEDGKMVFSEAYRIGKKLCFIPFRSSYVLFVMEDKIELVEMPVKGANYEGENRTINSSYRFLYILKERYLGIYSYKSRSIFEIDTKNMSIRRRNIRLDDSAIDAFKHKILNERDMFDKYVFPFAISGTGKKNEKKDKEKDVGKRIYEEALRSV